MKNINTWIKAHKKTSIFIIVVVIAIAAYGGMKAFGKTSTETRYVTTTVSKGNIISSVTGSGQVAASNEFDLKTKASGKITSLNVQAGQQISQGALIAAVDSSDAALELKSAKLSYEDTTTVDPDDITNAQDAVTKAESDKDTSYVDARNTIATSLTDMANTVGSLADLYGKNGYLNNQKNNIGNTAMSYRDAAETSYYTADKAVKDFAAEYRTISNSPDDATIEAQLSKAATAADIVGQAAKDAKDAVTYIRNQDHTNDQTTADAAYSSVNSLVSDANNTQSDITSSQKNITDSIQSLAQDQTALSKLEAGVDEEDLVSAQLSLKEKQEAYDDYFTYAPFDGILASLEIHKGDEVSSGATIGTFITKDKVADISLNEVDATKVKVGQKATLTFDAVDGLSITGQVVSVDLVGTVSQGVVSYDVKIAFDTDDDRVKAGMSVSAAIITDSKEDVLTVPSSAIKTNGDTSYVDMFATPLANSSASQGAVSAVAPVEQDVEVGLSDDTNTEITSGLKEGDQIVTKTITAATTAAAAKTTTTTARSATSLLGGTGATRAGGGGGFAR